MYWSIKKVKLHTYKKLYNRFHVCYDTSDAMISDALASGLIY